MDGEIKVTLFTLFISLLLVGCGEDIVDATKLQHRNGLKYLPNQETPFSGRVESFYENGQKKEEATYKKGKVDGLRTHWYANGQKYFSSFSENGKTTCLTYWYEENGQKKSEVVDYSSYQHKVISWYKNGLKASEVVWRGDINGGKPISAKVWKTSGEKCTLTNLKNGNGIKASYSDDPTWQSHYNTYKDGELINHQSLQ